MKTKTKQTALLLTNYKPNKLLNEDTIVKYIIKPLKH